jgi:simple sugar transport system substrate-binding protein
MLTKILYRTRNFFLFSILSLFLLTFIGGCDLLESEEEHSEEKHSEEEHSKDEHDGHSDIKKFGMILVGPRDDKGWSQAHFEGGAYIEEKLGAEMIVADFINPADSPNTTVEQVANDMIEQGAELIFATSDDMKDGILAAAEAHPDVPMIWASGDSAWADGKAYKPNLTNLGNIMPQMEYGKYLAGCAAALESTSGNIGFLGPLINDETRRLANAAYLGARDCWSGGAALNFQVTWIGFWFHIPGVTLDPTIVVNDFYDSGVDVVISHIDTPEALIETDKRAAAGEDVLVVGYDYEGSCELAPTVCLGVPYFNWGPAYLDVAESVSHDNFEAGFDWIVPNFSDLNNKDSSAIGFIFGDALAATSQAKLESIVESFDKDLTTLFSGPVNFQDGTNFVPAGGNPTLNDIWYTPQLLEGMTGDSGVN